jgi:hypothetical protein
MMLAFYLKNAPKLFNENKKQIERMNQGTPMRGHRARSEYHSLNISEKQV